LSKRLKLKFVEPLSIFASSFNLRGYTMASLAAQDRLQTALADRPVVAVSITVHAPRVAVPSVPTPTTDQSADPSDRVVGATLLLDLGRFELRSCAPVELGASADQAKLFNAFRIKVSDISASIAEGQRDPTAAWNVAAFEAGAYTRSLFSST
jgi:hypothetical protein